MVWSFGPGKTNNPQGQKSAGQRKRPGEPGLLMSPVALPAVNPASVWWMPNLVSLMTMLASAGFLHNCSVPWMVMVSSEKKLTVQARLAPYCNSVQVHSLGRYADISPQKSAVAVVARRSREADFMVGLGQRNKLKEFLLFSTW